MEHLYGLRWMRSLDPHIDEKMTDSFKAMRNISPGDDGVLIELYKVIITKYVKTLIRIWQQI